MSNLNSTPSQTKSFSTIFLIELWERFGFYGMQALIVFYMVQRLGFDDTRANLVWGAASALIYVAPAIGGWVGDSIFGTRRTMLIGAAILSIGYALIALPTENVYFLFAALGVIVVGNGLFKPNAGNLVRKIYEGDDAKIDSAFTIYYMAVNIGSTFSMLLTPWIKDWVNTAYQSEFGWHAAFGVCCAGLVVGLVNFYFMRATMAHIGSDPDENRSRSCRCSRCSARACSPSALTVVILQNRDIARAFVVLAGCRHARHLRLPDREESARRARRPHRRAGADRPDDVLLHLLPADVDVAVAVRAAQRRSGDEFLRLARVRLAARAVPGAEPDLDHGALAVPRLGLHALRASAARICRSPPSSRSASPPSRSASSSTASPASSPTKRARPRRG